MMRPDDLLKSKHEKLLQDALRAIRERTYWSPFPEVPSGKVYGETAKEAGYAVFQAQLGKSFELDQVGAVGIVGDEVSPYGIELGISYPLVDLNVLMPAVEKAGRAWASVDVESRSAICLEILHRLNKRSFEIANAIMHTTGQGFMMAFQAGGPHAQDRGLEAVAYAYEEMTRYPEKVVWKKQVGKNEFVQLEKRFRLIPRGIGVVIGCSTFPTWNGYPALFASLMTGNGVVVKPHPGAILPLAITVKVAREVLGEQGFDPNVVSLAADGFEVPMAKELVTRPDVKIVDYTGGSSFGEWVEQNARQAMVFTEKAGVNSVILDSADDLRAVTGNLAFSLCLYSGQMCTTPKNIFIPKGGIRVGAEQISFDEVVEGIVGAINWLLRDSGRACEILGAIQNQNTVRRIDEARSGGGVVVRDSEVMVNERFPKANVRSPLMLKVAAGDKRLYMREMFGPITYIVETENTEQSVKLAEETALKQGAITGAVYSTDASVLTMADETLSRAGVPVSCNLTGQVYVNQSAAFSDFHVSGANPAGNATLCDGAFVANRFRRVQTRVPVN